MNGKAKIDFFNQCKYSELGFSELPKVCQQALIIEWLDSVGIYVNINREISNVNLWCFDLTFKKNLDHKVGENWFDNRQESTEKAIETAINIYNEKQK